MFTRLYLYEKSVDKDLHGKGTVLCLDSETTKEMLVLVTLIDLLDNRIQGYCLRNDYDQYADIEIVERIQILGVKPASSVPPYAFHVRLFEFS